MSQNHEHHHDHHQESFISKYIFSMDHKMIAKQYLITGMIMAVIAALISLLFRLQLGWPDQTFPWLESLLGDWGKGGRLDPNFYLALVTMHGTLMVFFVLTAGLSGTFSNLLIPFQIGARDMASPFMNMLSYWIFFLSSVIMLVSLFVESGPASAGWTIYPPLSALPQAVPGSGLGMTLWFISMTLFIASSLMGSLNYITTILNMRTVGMKMTRLPLTIWAFLTTSILGVLSFPVLLAAAILLIFYRSFGTSFLPQRYLYRRRGVEPSRWLADFVPALVLVPRSPRSVHRIDASLRYNLGGYCHQRTQAYFRLPCHDWFVARYFVLVVNCMGSPHVRNRHEPFLGQRIYDFDLGNCCAFGRKNLQLLSHAVER